MFNVLSLFDGISCGQLALNKANIKYDNYFASEINPHAISVTQHHFPKTIQLGDITKITGVGLPKIDLLIGGSPCQGFSKAGKQLNFDDPRSKLFFEYVRLLKLLKPTYFLLENVKMKKEYENIITDIIGIPPVLINSSLLSKQNRNRLYWSNIKFDIPKDAELYFNNWLYQLGHGWTKEEIKYFKKYPCLCARSPGGKYKIIHDINIAKNSSFEHLRNNPNIVRTATPEECEEFQTIPIGYTSMIKKTHRYIAIGNGWTVDIISHILQNIKQ